MFLPVFYKTKPSAQIQYTSVNSTNVHEFTLDEATFSRQCYGLSQVHLEQNNDKMVLVKLLETRS